MLRNLITINLFHIAKLKSKEVDGSVFEPFTRNTLTIQHQCKTNHFNASDVLGEIHSNSE